MRKKKGVMALLLSLFLIATDIPGFNLEVQASETY